MTTPTQTGPSDGGLANEALRMADIDAPESLLKARERLTELLDRAELVSEAVLRAAIDDPLYAMHLLSSRTAPGLQDVLLENPPKPASLNMLSRATPGPAPDQSPPAVLRRFGKAMIEWGKSGFKTVDEEVYLKRLTACSRCPDLHGKSEEPAPEHSDLPVSFGQTCGLCGCFVRAKARIQRESCPGRHPIDTWLSRWGEPI